MGSSPISSIVLVPVARRVSLWWTLFMPNICQTVAVTYDYACRPGGTTQYCFQPHCQTQHARAEAILACILNVGARLLDNSSCCCQVLVWPNG